MIQRPIERVLEEFLVAAAPSSVPTGLQRAIVDQVARSPQRRPITVLRWQGVGTRRGFLAVAAVAILATTWGVVSFGTPTQSPAATSSSGPSPSTWSPGLPPSSPVVSTRADDFLVPFTFTAPEYLEVSPGEDLFTLWRRAVPGGHGVTFAIMDTPVAHGCSNPETAIRADPDGFLSDLTLVAGAPSSGPVPITVGGLPALQVDLDTERTCSTADVHVRKSEGLASGFIPLDRPTRLILVEAQGHHVAIAIWADDQATFDAWAAVARDIVASIRFEFSAQLPPSSPTLPFHGRVGETNPVDFDFVAPAYLSTDTTPLMYTIALHKGAIGGSVPPAGHGIVVAIVDTPFVHGASSIRTQIRPDAAGFLEDLVTYDDVTLSEPISVTIGDLPALQADVDPAATSSTSDVHLTTGLFNGFYLNQQSRVIALEAGGHHLAIVIWAKDAKTYASWLPTAEAIVDSFRFDP